MTLANTDKVAKLEVLEARIAAAVQRLNEVNTRCQELAGTNERLEAELAGLKESNTKLAQQVVELKAEAKQAPKRTVDEKKILYRIDRMLEKFGELQI